MNIQELRILGSAPHAEIGAAIAVELQGKAYAPIHDLPGNIAVLAPFDHGSVSIYRYSAFGEEKIDGSILSPWRFSSKRSDASTGLVYYGRRYYMPAFGRWLTPDPAGFTDGMNLYAFVHNDPLTHFDEYGLWLEPRSPGYFNSPQAFQFMTNSLVGMYNNPRFQGSMQAFGGLVETGVGAGMTYGTGGFLAPIGFALMAHGLDHTITGMSTAITGRSRDTVTSQLLQKTGMSSQTAGFVDNGFSIVGTMGGMGAIRAGQVVACNNYRLPMITTAPSIEESDYQGYLLKTHLSQLEKYGTDGYRQLSNGRIRYYDKLISPRERGEMIGRRRVREWDPQTSLKRTWHQTHDGNGTVRFVRPQTNDGIKIHYEFDVDGNYIGNW